MIKLMTVFVILWSLIYVVLLADDETKRVYFDQYVLISSAWFSVYVTSLIYLVSLT